MNDKILKYQYKDRLPKDTILLCEQYLEQIGIKYNIYWGEGKIVKSVKIQICDSEISASGKGVNEEYALASAYGELFERLLNMVYFRQNSHLLQIEHLENKVFLYKEKKEIEINIIKFLNGMFGKEKSLNITRSLIRYLNELYEEEKSVCSLYYNLMGEAFYLPCGMIDVIYGTNGMCSGNSREEALVQGISEIVERYSIYEILHNNVVLVNVTKNIISENSFLKEWIIELKKKNKSDIYIFQCKSKVNIPTFVLLYIDKEKQSYIVKVGVHGDYRIAIERCFTELLQGKSEKNIFGLSYMHNCDDFSQGNLEQIYKDGKGNYPISLFSAINNIGRIIGCKKNYNNNNEILEYYLKELKIKKDNILISDVSLREFYAYHIIIKGKSEVLRYEDFDKIVFRYLKIIKIIFWMKELNKRELSNEEILEFYNLLNIYKANYYITIDNFLNSVCNKEIKRYRDIVLNDYLIFCQSKLGLHEELKNNIINYMIYLKNKDIGLEKYKYYSCLLSLLKYGKRKIDEVKTIYNEKLVEKVLNDIKNNFKENCSINVCNGCSDKMKNSCQKYKYKKIFNSIFKLYNN